MIYYRHTHYRHIYRSSVASGAARVARRMTRDVWCAHVQAYAAYRDEPTCIACRYLTIQHDTALCYTMPHRAELHCSPTCYDICIYIYIYIERERYDSGPYSSVVRA